VAEGKG